VFWFAWFSPLPVARISGVSGVADPLGGMVTQAQWGLKNRRLKHARSLDYRLFFGEWGACRKLLGVSPGLKNVAACVEGA
jgi:hypothetical protein